MGQGDQFHLAGAGRPVQALDDVHQPLHIGGPVGQDQGAGFGVPGQVPVGGDQGAQDRHQPLRPDMLKVDYPGHDIISAGLLSGREHPFQLALVLRHDLGNAVGLHGGETVDLQHRLEHPVGLLLGQRLRRHHGHRALDGRVHKEVAAGKLRHGLDHGAEFRLLEIKIDVLRNASGGKAEQDGTQAQAAKQRGNRPRKRNHIEFRLLDGKIDGHFQAIA